MGDPSPRARARPSSVRLRDVPVGPAHVVLLLCFFCFFLKFKQFYISKFVQILD
jgi:hypothetical protein